MVCASQKHDIYLSTEGLLEGMVLLEGIELSTSPLPRECSTTELQQRRFPADGGS